ncbi:MAG: zinc ribbon domain-containing protein [Oscillospiraceae bacterium]|nr:zinc ribbon domain-containing protein [Oscillospiraceae bacterium]
MFCMNCGKEIEDGSKFCPYCGSAQAVAAVTAEETVELPVEEPVEAAPEAPAEETVEAPVEETIPEETVIEEAAEDEPMDEEIPAKPKFRFGKGVLIGAVAGLAAIVAVVVLLITGVFAGPGGHVVSAINKTVDAYASAADNVVDITAAPDMVNEAYGMEMDLEIKKLSPTFGSEAMMLQGLGLNYNANADLEDRKVSVTVTPRLGSADILTADLVLDDNNLYIGLPDLLDEYYGINTETLGEDLSALGADMNGMESLGFNIFDMIEEFGATMEENADDKEMTEAFEKATKEFYKELEFEKVGKDEVDINGYDVNCTEYSVVIPQEALEDYVEAIFDIMDDYMAAADMTDAAFDMMDSLGVPQEAMAEAQAGAAYVGDVDFGEAFDMIRPAFDFIGDLEFTVYAKSGYLMGIEYEKRIEGVKVELGAYFGGGKNYVDDMSVVVSVADSFEIEYTSSGDHAAKSGTYSDKSVLTYDDGYESISATMKTEYETKSGEFEWSLDAMEFEAEAEGTFETDKKEFALNIDDFSLKAEGEEMISLAFAYSIGAYNGVTDVGDAQMLSDMTQEDLFEIAAEIMSIVQENPDMMDMFS